MIALLLFQAGSSADIGSASSEALAYVKLMVVLALILGAAVFGVHVLLPRLSSGRRLSSGVIQVTARLPLEPRKNLYVVKVGTEYFLVGTSEAGMQCLTPLKQESVETALDIETPPPGEFPALMEAFRRWKKAS